MSVTTLGLTSTHIILAVPPCHLLAGIQECQKVDERGNFEDTCSLLKKVPYLALDVVLLTLEDMVSRRIRSLNRNKDKYSGRSPGLITSGNSPHPCSVTMPFTLSMIYWPPTVTTPYAIFCVFVKRASFAVDCTIIKQRTTNVSH